MPSASASNPRARPSPSAPPSPQAHYATVGGSFPIAVPAAGGVIGAITLSGLPSRSDHELAVEALCHHLGKDYATLSLG